jgi:SAM-dependent methyltransferase
LSDEVFREARLEKSEVEALGYVDLMSLVEEDNRPPGGLVSLMSVRSQCLITSGHHVLDVGCNTGYVSFTLHELCGCEVTGIDLSPRMVGAARRKLASHSGRDRLLFEVGDAARLRFGDNTFDAAICGGSLPFMADPQAAVREMTRVTRQGGFVVSIDFYYEALPPLDLLEELARVLGFTIEPRGSDYWRDLFGVPGLEFAGSNSRPALETPFERVAPYVAGLLGPVEHKFTPDGLDAARARLEDAFGVFVRNAGHLSYVMHIGRKSAAGAQEYLLL